MSTYSDHVCEFSSKRMSSSKKYRKRYLETNSSNSSLFTCGGCHLKFRTICCLHVHIARHQEGGSYTYDHVTKTAFPKFDSVCAYTQVEQTIIELFIQNSEQIHKPSKSVQIESGEIETASIAVTRKSKRIAKRKENRNQATEKLGVETELDNSKDNAVSEMKEDGQNEKANSVVSAHLTKVSKSSESEGQKRKNNSVEYNTRFKKLKRRKQERESTNSDSDPKLSKTDDIQGDLSDLDGEEKVDCTDDTAKMRLDKLKSINQKTDEITASEALIAISKSADGDNTQNCNSGNKQVSESKGNEIGDIKVDFDMSSLSSGNRDGMFDVGDVNKSNNRQDIDGSQVADDKSVADNSTTLELMDKEFSQRGQVKEKSNKDTSNQNEHVETFKKKEKLECHTCGKVGSRAMLSYHRYLHKEKKELSCDKCGKQFQHPTCLKVHLRSHDEKLYQCEKCLAKFSRKKYLETHMLKHSGEKPYMCETCGKSYRDEMHLKRHIKHVHDQIRNFECDICKERFFRTDHLKCHRLRHFGPGLRCEFCQKKFKVHLDLDRHMVIHTGEKKWFCHLCGHGFRYPVPYINHMKKQHDVEREEAEVWRKKLIEDNKKSKPEPLMTESIESVSDLNNENEVRQTMNQSTARGEVTIPMNMSSIESVEPNVSVVRKIYIPQEEMYTRNQANKVDTTGIDGFGKTFHVDNIDKEVRNISDNIRGNVEQTSGLYLQQGAKGYEIIRLTGSQKETITMQQGLHFPVQNSFPEGGNSGTRVHVDRIVGYEDGDHLQGDQIVVMGEETVVQDINVMTELEGENSQAVMFIDDNECVGEVVIDQETTV